MSRFLNSHRRGHLADGEGGFTLIEVMIALLIFTIITAAVVPLLITSLRAGLIAKMDTGGRNLTQQRFELIRNLPFRIQFDAASPAPRDLLDYYYPNQAAPSGGLATNPGYVTTESRRSGEPPTGSFYRTRWETSLNGGTYTQWVAVQFLNQQTKAAVTPGASYNASSLNDFPPSTLLGVTVITEWQVGAMSKRYSVFSEVSDTAPLQQLIVAEGRATALQIATQIPLSTAPADVTLAAGTVNFDGSLGSAAKAAGVAQGVALSAGTTRVEGAGSVVSAPPEDTEVAASDNTDPELTVEGSSMARTGHSYVSAGTAKTAGGLPLVASATSPYMSRLYGNRDTTFTPGISLPGVAQLQMTSTSPVVVVKEDVGNTQAEASGYLNTAAGASHSVISRVSAWTRIVRVMPTTSAPEGLVQIRLLSSNLTCTATSTASAAAEYSAEYRVAKLVSLTDPTLGTTYTNWMPLSHSQTTDPLQGISLATDSTGWPVAWNGSRVLMLGEYISSMSSQTASSLAALRTVDPTGKRVESRAGAMVSVGTVPLRQGEDLSGVTVEIGHLSCIAEDRR